MSEDRYAGLEPTPERDEMNSIRFWLPKIQGCGMDIPSTVLIDVPREIQQAFCCESQQDFRCIQSFVDGTVLPAARNAGFGLLFLKNGCFSDKFEAGAACLPVMDSIAPALMHIMQGAMMCCGFQYDGTDVIAVRERIPHDPGKAPCIYGGLPFRPEFRVFYDFDRKEPLFTADYWDRGYVYPNLRDMTDRLVFDGWYGHIREMFDRHKGNVEKMVSGAMEGVQGLPGPWSIDVMMDEASGKFWLIDMAVAEMSAYWDMRPGSSGQ